jgi:hypothetical protein
MKADASPITYFVSYQVSYNYGHAFGNATMSVDGPIRTDADIRRIEEALKGRNEHANEIVILNYILMGR